MTKCLLLALSLSTVACTVGSGDPANLADASTGGSGSGSGGGSGSGTGISGDIATDTTWSGTMNLLGAVTVKPGVTLTVAPGTTVTSATDASITVQGTLLETGAKGNVVTFNNVALQLPSGGTATLTYAVHSGGGIETSTGGTITITDSVLSHAQGDFLVMSGGSVTMDYSQIGVGAPTDATRGADTTHCDMHFNPAAGSVMKINHSNIASSSYGIMLYQSGADLTNNNWYGNQNDFEPGVTGVTGTADGSWFKSGTPTGVQGVSFNNLATSPIPGNGPR